MLKPNYNDCIINIISSFKKYYNKEYAYPTNPIVDKVLEDKKPKHIVLMILDGLGSNVLDKHKNVCSFLLDNKVKDISSVYPSTTSASIPTCVSGKAPIETCWIGWTNYLKEVDRHVVFFKNTDFVTNEKLDINVNEIFPYESFCKDYDIPSFSIGPSFYVDGCKNFKTFTKKILKTIKENQESYIYAYWDDPDYNLHEYGTDSKKITKILKNINKNLIKLSKDLKDTCLIISADHGHIDCEPIYLRKYNDLYCLLNRMPSNEARCAFFSVKEDKKEEFEILFNKYFKEDFILMTKEEFLKNEFLGLYKYSTKHSRVDDLIGDYVGIAIGDKYFNHIDIDESDFIFKSHHAGLTKEELTVPLIIFNK